MTDDKGKVMFHTAFAISHSISEQNVEGLVEAGRCRVVSGAIPLED
jgi:hypothetical protein